MKMNSEFLYKAVLARDPRYDGRFFTGVITTGIYCRPICPARPKFENIKFFRSKAEAEAEGFRPCLRCRPDLSPLSPQWSGTAAIMKRALNLIDDLSAEENDLKSIADKLGMTDRHLRRLFKEHLGVAPMSVTISKRLHLARQLLSQTHLPITEIAFASGFNSLRRFNDAFQKIYRKTPGQFRKEASSASFLSSGLILELPYTAPFNWPGLLAFFKRHEIFGVDLVEDDSYSRHFKHQGKDQFYKLTHEKRSCHIIVDLRITDITVLRIIIEKIKRQVDIAHNPYHIDCGKFTAGLRNEIQGVRIPGAFDAFEVAVTIIIGQLVSIKQANDSIQKLIVKHGEKIQDPQHPKLNYYFPDAKKLCDADLSGLGLTATKIKAIKELSRQFDSGEIDLSHACDLEETQNKLHAIKGIGDWTVSLISLRCLRDSNAFPRTDLIIKRAIDEYKYEIEGICPWRGYLTFALWNLHAEELTKKRKTK